MLVTGAEVLSVAHTRGFAVPAFNISDYAMFRGVVETCEELGSPLIVAIHPDELSHTGPEIVAAVRERAHRASVPVAVHLDHGATREQALLAIQCGFSSVMLDGSMFAFEENVVLTRGVVELAHAVGVSVEGELGTIGKADGYGETGAEHIMYTDPADAVQFVAQTGVDSLAIAIGTSHGLYPAGMRPELRLELLREIRAVIDVPLVLHGGSGNPDEEIAEAARTGISKINISSDIKAAYHDRMREVLADPGLREPNVIQPSCVAAMNAVAAHKIELFNASGQARWY